MATVYTRSKYNAPPLGRNMARQSAPLEAFLHHTDDKPSVVQIYNTKTEQTAKVHAIDTQHRNQGWSMGGYHWVVFQQTGTRHFARAFQLRPATFVPAAQLNHNTRTLAIAVVGNGNVNSLFEDTEKVILDILRRYKRIRTLGGHRDVVATNCPGDRIYAEIPSLARRAGLKVYK